jgi:predicted PurR-regulated permease PerM
MELTTQQGKLFKAIMIMASLVIVFAGIKTAAELLVPFLLSIFIAMACNPIINKATEYKIPKGVAVLFVILMFVLVALSLAGLVGRSANELSARIPVYREQLSEQILWLTAKLSQFNIQISSDVLMEYFDPSAAMGLVAGMVSGVGGVMANLFLIVLTVVFMLFEASSIPKKLHIALDDPQMRMQQIDKFLSSINSYLAIKSVVSIGTGLVIGTMLYLFGLDFYLLWGVLAFMLNFIPNIGSIIAAVPAVLLALLQLGPAPAGLIALGYVLTNMVMGNVIEPRYMGRGLGLSTLVVFLSLIFWGWLLGTVGMLLSVPLTMMIKIALESSQGGNWFAVLLSSEQDHQ